MNYEKPAAERGKKFYPDYLFEIMVVNLATLEIVLVLSYVFASATGRPVDFSRNFLPLPEWYFLFLYELLKYFPGDSAFIGVMVIPAAALAWMFALPFIEKAPSRKLSDRKPTAIFAAFLMLSSIVLTILAVV